MVSRPRSVPPAASTSRVTRSSGSPSSGIIAVHRTRTTIPGRIDTSTVLPLSSTSLATNRNVTTSRLEAQADALAKMTLEMNLRSVSRQADRLERELRSLIQTTSQDKEFRAQNEARLKDMWKEILAVKSHMAQERETRHLTDDVCQQEMKRIADEMKGELDTVRQMVGNITTTLSEMPSVEQMHAALSQSQGSSDADGRRSNSITEEASTAAELQSLPKKPSIQERIREAIKSTRRWNHDHKITRHTDAIFCASYLRQQSKRDAAMAVFLQRAIQRRVQARFPGRRLRPQSLDDFCQVVKWTDVKGVVEDVLLRDTTDVVEALSK